MSDPVKVYLTKVEAIKYIKKNYRAGVTHFVRAGAFLYTLAPDQVKDGEEPRGYSDCGTNIKVSQKDALKYVNDILRGPFEEKGCMIEIVDYKDGAYGGSMFIG